MHFTQVHTDPDVYLIRVPFDNYKLDSTNCYVVKDGGEALVVDTGAPSPEGRMHLAAAFDELELDLANTSFFLTHLHLDHAGLIDYMAPEQAPIHLNRCDYVRTLPDEVARRFDLLYDELVAEGASPGSTRKCIGSRSRFSNIIKAPHRLFFTSEGDAVNVGRHTFRVVDTAGHTPGHQSLFHPESGILFGGDHILFVMSSSIGLFLPEGDGLQTYLDNLEKTRRLQPRILLHSHGPLRDDIAERIDWLAHHQAKRAERVRRLVEEAPGSTGFEITKHIGFKVPGNWDEVACVQRLTMMEIGAAFLRHLTLKGAIERIVDDQGIRRYFPAK